MQSGVYVILNRVNGKRYVGSSVSVKYRINGHRIDLERGVHYNTHLQSSWDKYGKDSFKFTPLVFVERNALESIEQSYIDHFKATDPKHGYNKCPVAGSPRGFKRPLRTEEHRKKLVEARRRSGSYVKSEATIKCLSKALTGRTLSKESVQKRQETRKSNDIFLGRKYVKSEEAIRKHAESLRGYKHSKETRERMSKAGKGR